MSDPTMICVPADVWRRCAPFLRACADVRKAIDLCGVYTRDTPEGERLWNLFQDLHAREEKAWAECRGVIDRLLAVAVDVDLESRTSPHTTPGTKHGSGRPE
jgi:hypothetical protein